MINANDQHIVMPVGEPAELMINKGPPNAKLWVTRGSKWISTVTMGSERRVYLHVTNLGEQQMVLPSVPLGMWMESDMIPRYPGYVSVESRRYNEWQT